MHEQGAAIFRRAKLANRARSASRLAPHSQLSLARRRATASKHFIDVATWLIAILPSKPFRLNTHSKPLTGSLASSYCATMKEVFYKRNNP
jgi:hypothetical protein